MVLYLYYALCHSLPLGLWETYVMQINPILRIHIDALSDLLEEYKE